MTFQSVFHLQ